MRIVQITPGSGGEFYCENCLRDNALVKAMRGMGHDVSMISMYLPLLDEASASTGAPVFFGGVNVYLQQKLALFRHTPRWVDRVFDTKPLLRWAAGMSGMTSARDLGETTLSMLRGEQGRQVKELDRLVDFLAEHDRPDVVSISNGLLVGLVPRIKERLGAPVVVALQDEDGFLDGLGEPYAEQAWALVRERGREVDAWAPVSAYYAERMKERLGLAAERVHVVPCGLDPEGYAPAAAAPERPVVGFLSHMSPSQGLDRLAEAFILLKRAPGLEGARLRITGGMTAADDAYVADVKRRLREAGVAGDVEFVANSDRAGKIEFLRSLSVLSVPGDPEAFGLFVLEAWAAGVPVVQPAHGAFVELVDSTGGGRLTPPGDPEALAAAIGELLADPAEARRLGAAGRAAVMRQYHIEEAARRFVRVCETAAASSTQGERLG